MIQLTHLFPSKARVVAVALLDSVLHAPRYALGSVGYSEGGAGPS